MTEETGDVDTGVSNHGGTVPERSSSFRNGRCFGILQLLLLLLILTLLPILVDTVGSNRRMMTPIITIIRRAPLDIDIGSILAR
jgi:hypothetical protein